MIKIHSKKKHKSKRRSSTPEEGIHPLIEVVIQRSSESFELEEPDVGTNGYCTSKFLILTLIISVAIHGALAFWWFQNAAEIPGPSTEETPEKSDVPSEENQTDSVLEDDGEFDPIKEFSGPLSQNKKAQETLKELNFARTEPKRYCKERIEPLLKKVTKTDHGWSIERKGFNITMKEGLPLIEETIKYLNEVKPCPPFKGVVEPLCKSAQDHCNDCGPKGIFGHIGSDKSTPHDRINRHCYSSTTSENIAYGYSHPKDVIAGLIIDDDVPNRGHRLAIFNPDLAYLGVYEAWFDSKKAGRGLPSDNVIVHNMAKNVLPLKPEAQTFNITDVNCKEMKRIYMYMHTKKAKEKTKDGIQDYLDDESCHVRVTYDPKKVYDGDDKNFQEKLQGKPLQYLLVEKIGKGNKVYASRPRWWT